MTGRPAPRPGAGDPHRRRRSRATRVSVRRRALELTGLVLALVVVGTGAGSGGVEPGDVRAVADTDRPAAEAPPTTEPAPPTPEAPTPVTLAFAGDINTVGPSGDAVRAGLPSIRDTLGAADLTVVNVETAITERGTPAPKKFVFRAPAATLSSLREAGVDVAAMANNHALDFGREGLSDALAASASTGLPVVGLGQDEDQAYAAHTAVVRGQRIAVLGATQVLDSNLAAAWTAGPEQPGMASAVRVERLVEEVRKAREDADTVVVYLHWGQERNPCPLPRQQELARQLVDAGADVLVGTHAHVLLGGGFLDGAYVDYGLGNFVFGARSEEGARTGVLTLTVAGREVTGVRWSPAQVRNGAPVPLEGAEAQAAVADKERRRDCTGLAAAPTR